MYSRVDEAENKTEEDIFLDNFFSYLRNEPLTLPKQSDVFPAQIEGRKNTPTLDDKTQMYLYIYNFVADLYWKIENSTLDFTESLDLFFSDEEESAEKERWRNLETSIRQKFSPSLDFLDEEQIRLMLLFLHNWSEKQTKMYGKNPDKSFLPYTNLYGGKKYYYTKIKGQVNSVPHFYPYRTKPFCPEVPFFISESEIPYVEVNGKRIGPEQLKNPYFCNSQLPEHLRTEKFALTPLQTSDLPLRKKITSYCSRRESSSPRCEKYYDPIEIGELSRFPEGGESLTFSIVPEVVIGENDKFKKEVRTLTDLYLNSVLFSIFKKYIKYFLVKEKLVGIYGYTDDGEELLGVDVYKEMDVYVFFDGEEKYKIDIPNEIKIFNIEEQEQKIFFLDISYYVKGRKIGHALSLLIDKELKTFEFFDPHGFGRYDDKMYDICIKIGKKLLPDYSPSTADFCPAIGLQKSEAETNDVFCSLWNLFYAENYARARRRIPAQVFRQTSFHRLLLDELRKNGPGYTFLVIISYLCYKFHLIAKTFPDVRVVADLEEKMKKNPLYTSYVQTLSFFV